MIEIIPNWHPLFVHFTVALLTMSALFLLMSKFAVNWRLEDQWLAVGYWCLWIGTLITIGTVIAGWFAFNSVTHDTPSHEIMLEHRQLAVMTLAVFMVLSVWAILGFRSKKEPSVILVLAVLLSTGLLYNTAWHGGELVYRHGLGVMALPNPDDHKHADGHGGHDHGGGSASGGEHDHGAAGAEHDHGAMGESAEHDHGGAGEAAEHDHGAMSQPHDHDATGEAQDHDAAGAEDAEHTHDDGEQTRDNAMTSSKQANEGHAAGHEHTHD